MLAEHIRSVSTGRLKVLLRHGASKVSRVSTKYSLFIQFPKKEI